MIGCDDQLNERIDAVIERAENRMMYVALLSLACAILADTRPFADQWWFDQNRRARGKGPYGGNA